MQDMRIAVDTRSLEPGSIFQPAVFTMEVLRLLTIQHPEHQFLLFTDVLAAGLPQLPGNLLRVTISPRRTNLLLYKWWYDVKLPLALKKYKIDVFIGANGIGSLTSAVPQILFLHDLAFFQKNKHTAATADTYRKRYFRRFVTKAKTVLTQPLWVRYE